MVAVAVGCRAGQPASVTVRQAWEAGGPTATTRPIRPDGTRVDGAPAPSLKPRPPSGGGAVAVVNGEAVRLEAVVETLLEAHGLNVLQQQIALTLARQAAEAARLGVSATDVEREYDLTLAAANSDSDGGVAISARKAELIELWMKRTGVSATELRLAMTRQAYLRKLAEPRVKIDDAALQAEFERVHGEKVEARVMELATLRDCERVLGELRGGADFAALAATRSLNELTARDGGLLPPFSRGDERLPEVLRAGAFSLKPGEVSRPIALEGHYYLIRVERRLPRENRSWVLLRDVLERRLRARRVAAEMDKLASELLMRARVEILDPALKAQYERERAAGHIAGPGLAS